MAKKAAEVFDKNKNVEGLILDKHGIFTFGADAREAYERMIEFVTLAENRLRKNRKAVFAAAKLPQRITPAIDVAPILRGACTLRDGGGEGAHRRPILEFRAGDAILNFVNGKDVAAYARAGVITPDHVIRTKPWPLIVPAPQDGKLDAFKAAAFKAAQKFIGAYTTYFARNKKRARGAVMHDPAPRVVLVPGLGLFGLGTSKHDAIIAADIAQAAVESITDAEAIGRYTSISQADMFDIEYWPLELAKLGARKHLPLAGQVAVITGAGGAIGAATAQAFAGAGAEVALLDLDADAAMEKAKAIGGNAIAIKCDVTNAASVRAAFDVVTATFGGVDIAISNAGAAWQGRIGEVDEAVLRESFELNFFAHQKVAQAAVKVMLAQGTGGCLLFNVSKQAVNPGANFGPYGLPKAATLVPGAAIRARLRRRRHPCQCGERRPHPFGAAHRRFHQAALEGARDKRKRLYDRQSAGPRGHRAGRGAGLPGPGAGAQDHRRRHHRGRREYCSGAAIKCYRDSGSRTAKGAMTMLRILAIIGLLPLLLLASPASALTKAEKMETCKFGADDQKLEGAKRKAFIAKCMSNRNDKRGPARSRRPRNRWQRSRPVRRRHPAPPPKQ